MTEENLEDLANFDIDDILKEIAEKEKYEGEQTAILDRKFFEGMVEEYHYTSPKEISVLFPKVQVNINEYNFTGADFRNIALEHLDLFDFKNCILNKCKFDRNTLDFFKDYIRKQTIKYNELIFDDTDLSPKLMIDQNLGINCYMILNLSNLDLKKASFKKCNLMEVIFDDCDINNCNFIGAQFEASQFAYAKNFETAHFYEDKNLNDKFINKLKKLSKKTRPTEEMFISKTNHFLAKLFDTPDPIRIDDPAYIKMKNELIKQNIK